MTDRKSAEYWLAAPDGELAKGYAELVVDETAAREDATWDVQAGTTLDDEDFRGWPGYPERWRR